MPRVCHRPRKNQEALPGSHMRGLLWTQFSCSLEQSPACSLMWGEKFWERAAPSSCHVTRLASRSSAGVWALLQGSALHKNMSAFQLNATLKNIFSSTPGPEKRLPALGARDISAISLYFQICFTVLWFPSLLRSEKSCGILGRGPFFSVYRELNLSILKQTESNSYKICPAFAECCGINKCYV